MDMLFTLAENICGLCRVVTAKQVFLMILGDAKFPPHKHFSGSRMSISICHDAGSASVGPPEIWHEWMRVLLFKKCVDISGWQIFLP